METKNNLDLSKFIVGWLTSRNGMTYQMRVSKQIYDNIRMDINGVVDIEGKEWKIVEFETDYIGMGEDFTLDISLSVVETLRSKRQEKLNKLV